MWDPYYLRKEVKELEKVQNRALRFTFKLKGRASFSQIRQDTTSVTLLKDRRKELRHNLQVFVNLIESGVVDDKHSNSKQQYQTAKRAIFFIH